MKALLVMVGLAVGLGSSGAQADEVALNGVQGNQIVNLNGVWGGVANELFSILDLGGAQQVPITEGREVRGDLIAVHISHFTPNAARFDATVRIDQDSAVTVNPRDASADGTTVVLTGDVAQELYTDMQKAGLPKHQGVDGSTYVGTHLNCMMLVLGRARYSCSLRAQ